MIQIIVDTQRSMEIMSESKNTREGKKNKNKINEAQSTIHNDAMNFFPSREHSYVVRAGVWSPFKQLCIKEKTY